VGRKGENSVSPPFSSDFFLSAFLDLLLSLFYFVPTFFLTVTLRPLVVGEIYHHIFSTYFNNPLAEGIEGILALSIHVFNDICWEHASGREEILGSSLKGQSTDEFTEQELLLETLSWQRQIR
jgi:hypothetical protein